MTDQTKLDQWKALADAATKALADAETPGPWVSRDGCSWRRMHSEADIRKSRAVLEHYVARDGHPDMIVREEDQRFIAASREAVPALIAEVERLTAALACREDIHDPRSQGESMTRDETIEMMAKAIYLSKRHVTSWGDALDWFALEPHSTPALDVKTCRSDALAALTALEAAGMVVVPQNPTFEMIEAGIDAFYPGLEVIYPDEWETPDQAIIATYRAMIKEATEPSTKAKSVNMSSDDYKKKPSSIRTFPRDLICDEADKPNPPPASAGQEG